METSRRLRGGGNPQPRSQARPLPAPLSLYPSTSSSAAQSSLPLNRVHAPLPATPPPGHSHLAHDAPSPPLTPSLPSNPPQLRPESWQSVTQDSVLDNLLLSFDRMMPGSAAGPAEHRPNMPDIHGDDFDMTSTTFTPPRALQRLQQRVRGHTYSSSASHDSDTISNNSQLTARIRTNSHSDSRPSTVQSVDYGYGQVLGTTRIGGHDRSDPRTQGTPEVVSNGILDRGRPIPS
ncbi:hypothetical protein KCV02_g23465, partial [Aureobasidium melanogenum]